MKEAIVRAIKDVLVEDPVSDNTIIGYIDGYQKERIIQRSTFSFSAVVVSVLMVQPIQDHILTGRRKDDRSFMIF